MSHPDHRHARPSAVPVQTEPRPGSRAARMAHPLILHAIRQIAADHGVCIRPQCDAAHQPGHRRDPGDRPALQRRLRAQVPTLRQAQETTAHRCSCARAGTAPTNPTPARDRRRRTGRADPADRAHLEVRPGRVPRPRRLGPGGRAATTAIAEARGAAAARRACAAPHPPRQDRDTDDGDGQGGKRKRSTRRRQDAPDLPRRKVVGPHGRAGVRHQGRQDLPPVHLPDRHAGLVRAGPRRRLARRPEHATTTGGPPGTPCISRPCWTGSGRTCAAPRASTSSTWAPSNPNAAWPRTATSPSAAPCRTRRCARSSPPPTTRSGGPAPPPSCTYPRPTSPSGTNRRQDLPRPDHRPAAPDLGRGHGRTGRRAGRRPGPGTGVRGALRRPGQTDRRASPAPRRPRR